MNVHISYKVSKTPDLEKTINQQVEKLGRYLQLSRPELVHLKGVVEENSAREGFVVSLNLRLPSGQMASQESGPNASAAIKAAFDALTEQLKKHKDLLRNHHRWSGRRSGSRVSMGTVPFEETIAAIKPEQVSASDISGYINVNLPRFQRYIQRELDYRVSDGRVLPGQVEVQEVVAEAVASALSEQHDKPERIKLEPWLYRLARNAIDRLAFGGGEEYHIPLEPSDGGQRVRSTDGAVAQFHPSDERLFAEEKLPAGEDTPEDLAARSEVINLLEVTLREAGRDALESFILYTVEGFTLDEIADITNHNREEVRTSIAKAREHLQRALPMKDALKQKLVEYSKTA